jgi:hypothetical protein
VSPLLSTSSIPEYGLQLQHFNPNIIQQMAAFEALCEGYLGVGAHWHLFWYFFKFICLKDNKILATIGCTNLRTKQGGGRVHVLSSSLTSSNNGWHKGWFYLKNDPEHVLPEYTGVSIVEAPRNWNYGPVV